MSEENENPIDETINSNNPTTTSSEVLTTKTLLPFEKIQREVFTRINAKTDPKYGKNPIERTVEELINFGIINVNKPKGPTSHQASAYLQKILKIKKSGHSGTLDPNVTGVLPTATGRATRAVQTLLTAGKEYICIMHLHQPVDKKSIKKACRQFVGKIKQLPPIKSAIKRQWRYRKIYYLKIIEIKDQDVLFRIGCQAGTYIRKICHDIGAELGCGGHMAELVRTKAGPFFYNNMKTLQDLTDAVWYWKNEDNEEYVRDIVKPVEFAVSHLPKVWIMDSTVNSLCHGSDLKVPGIAKVESEIQPNERVAILTLKEELVAIGTTYMKSKDMINKEKGIAVKTEKVFMLPGIYPRIDFSSPKNTSENS